MNYPKIPLTEDEGKCLAALEDKNRALQTIIETAQQSWERRGAELVSEGREVWRDLGKKYNLDLERVNYTLSPDGKELVPIQVRLQ